MNQLSQLAARYYETVESLRALRSVPWRLYAGVGVVGVIFCINFLRVAGGLFPRPGGTQYFVMAQMLVSEALLMFLASEVQAARDRAVVASVRVIVGRPGLKTLSEAKKALLAQLFRRPASAFLALAEDARKGLEHDRADLRGLGLRWDDLFSLVYHNEARPRIVALLLAAVAGFSALALSSNEVRELGLALLYEVRLQLPALWLTGVTVLTGLMCACGIAHRVFWWSGEHLARRLSGPSGHSPSLIRYLQRELARHHDFVVAADSRDGRSRFRRHPRWRPRVGKIGALPARHE